MDIPFTPSPAYTLGVEWEMALVAVVAVMLQINNMRCANHVLDALTDGRFAAATAAGHTNNQRGKSQAVCLHNGFTIELGAAAQFPRRHHFGRR